MLSLLSLTYLAPMPLPPAGYTMADICRRLTSATGTHHSVDASLIDYPVFLSIKNPTSERVESLVATALHSNWKQSPQGLELTAAAAKPDEDFAEFLRQYKKAFTGKAVYGLPARVLYEMKPGTTLRFGRQPSPHVIGLPASMTKSKLATPKLMWRIRRNGYGIFDHIRSGWASTADMFTASGRTFFDSLPSEVETQLKMDLSKPMPVIPLGQPRGEDPMTDWATPMLSPLGSLVSTDLAIALPDSVWDAIQNNLGQKPLSTVRDALALFSSSDQWMVTDNAVVARLTPMETLFRTQTSRSAFNKFVDFARHHFMVSLPDLEEYLRSERPGAIETGNASNLNLSSYRVVTSEAYGSDYPYNVLMYGSLTTADWSLLRSGRKFPLALYSAPVQADIQTLLLQSMARLFPQDSSSLERGVGDPGLWSSLSPSKLQVQAKIEELPVLLTWTGDFSQVESVSQAGTNYETRRKTDPSPILFQPATNQSVKITISNSVGDSVETGFATTVFDHAGKPVKWQNLPRKIAVEFSKAANKPSSKALPKP